MAVEPFLAPSLVIASPPVATRSELFAMFAQRAARKLRDPALPADRLAELLEARERQQATAVPEGIAFPHVIDAAVPATLLGAALLRPSLEYCAGVPPVGLCFVLFGSSATPWVHVRTLARLARLVHQPEARERIMAAHDDAELLARLLQEDRSHG